MPEVRVDDAAVVLKWPRFDRQRVSLALQVAGFRPAIASNQVRIPVPRGRDPVETARRALEALAAPEALRVAT